MDSQELQTTETTGQNVIEKHNERTYTTLDMDILDKERVLHFEGNLYRQLKFLESYRSSETGGVIIKSCERSGVPRASVYVWLKEDPIFKDLFDQATRYVMDLIKENVFSSYNRLLMAGHPTIVMRSMEQYYPEIVGRRSVDREQENKGGTPASINNTQVNYYSFTEEERNSFNNSFREFLIEKTTPTIKALDND